MTAVATTARTWTEVLPLGDLLVRSAALHPERAALVFPQTRRTYAELREGATRVARGLVALGVKPGEHVGLLAINGPEFVDALFAITLLGCVVVPLSARHKPVELRYILRDADLVALVTTAEEGASQDFCALLRDSLPSLTTAADPAALKLAEAPKLRVAALLSGSRETGFLSRAELDQRAETVPAVAIDDARRRVRVRDAALILYTSGTTANPKGCVIGHEAATRGAVERASSRFATGTPHDVTWGAGPLFHIGSLGPFIGSMGSAGTYLTDARFDPGRALALMMREKVTFAVPWFPAIVQGLLDHPTFDPTRLERLRRLLVIGPPSLVVRLQTQLPQTEILQACGMTETAGIFALASASEGAERRAVTHGKPAPGLEVRIRDVDSDDPARDAKPGVAGEILVRGYCVMDGYYRDPEKTAAALDEGRWLHTGDLYSLAEDGNLVFSGRLKDMLKVGGENVAAIEVEAFLCEHPAVKAAEVVGRPDERLDEVPVAFIELQAGTAATEEELIAFCRGRIAGYKVPRAIHFVAAEEWPMSATKVDKRALRERLR